MLSKAGAVVLRLFLFEENMPVVAPNTPRTAWIRDSGTVITTTTDVLVDESGNFFVDESGNNLLDSLSTDGNALAHSWDSIADSTTTWAAAFEPRISTDTRTTAQGDTRTTAQGDTRTALTSAANREPLTTWTEDEYA